MTGIADSVRAERRRAEWALRVDPAQQRAGRRRRAVSCSPTPDATCAGTPTSTPGQTSATSCLRLVSRRSARPCGHTAHLDPVHSSPSSRAACGGPAASCTADCPICADPPPAARPGMGSGAARCVAAVLLVVGISDGGYDARRNDLYMRSRQNVVVAE